VGNKKQYRIENAGEKKKKKRLGSDRRNITGRSKEKAGPAEGLGRLEKKTNNGTESKKKRFRLNHCPEGSKTPKAGLPGTED